MRKHPSWFESSFDPGPSASNGYNGKEKDKIQNRGKKLRKNWSDEDLKSNGAVQCDRGSNSKSKSIRDQSPIDASWIDRCAPRSRAELAVNPKKVEEVESWLRANQGRPSILLLTGPVGAGKSATLRVLCSELDLRLEEWLNPSTASSDPGIFDEECPSSSSTDVAFPLRDALPCLSQTKRFADFLFSSRYKSLTVHSAHSTNSDAKQKDQKEKVILVEDIPNAFIRDPKPLWDILRLYGSKGRDPLVFVVSDAPSSSDSNVRHLFPTEQLSSLSSIVFRPIAVSFILKAIQRLLDREGKKIPKVKLQELAESSLGDIRSAIYKVQLCLKSPSSSSGKQDDKDTTLLLFRALGRFFYAYNKREEEGTLMFDPEDAIERSTVSPDLFVQFLHQNYPEFLPRDHSKNSKDSSMDRLTRIADDTSWADALRFRFEDAVNSDFAKDSYVATITARSIAFFNSAPRTDSKREFKAIRKPQFRQVAKDSANMIRSISNAFAEHRLSTSALTTEFLPYLSTLEPRFEFKSETQWQIVNQLKKTSGNIEKSSSFVSNQGPEYVERDEDSFTPPPPPSRSPSSDTGSVPENVDSASSYVRNDNVVIEDFSDDSD